MSYQMFKKTIKVGIHVIGKIVYITGNSLSVTIPYADIKICKKNCKKICKKINRVICFYGYEAPNGKYVLKLQCIEDGLSYIHEEAFSPEEDIIIISSPKGPLINGKY